MGRLWLIPITVGLDFQDRWMSWHSC